MPMNAAERQRKYREKLKSSNPEKFQEQKKKNCERTLRQYRDKTANYSEEQKKELRQKWREDRKKKEESLSSTSQKATQSSQQTVKNITDIQIMHNLQRRIEYKFKKENNQLQRRIKFIMNRFLYLQRKFQIQQKNIDSMKKMFETLLKKLEDSRTEEAKNTKNTDNNMNNNKTIEADEVFVPDVINKTAEVTPIKRVSEFINTTIPNVETPKKEKIKKKLIEHDLLKESFKCEYQKSSNAEKNTLKKIVNSDLVKKYKQTTNMRASLSLEICSYKKRIEYQKKRFQLRKLIASFYVRDDVSRATAGKKEYRTQNKMKYQKRYLLDKLKNLHKKYIAEVGKVSLSTFKKYRPFFVLPPKIKDCESCACIKHSNMQFMVDKLKSFGLIQNNNLNDVVSALVCDFKAKNCMYGVCTECSERKIDSGDKDLETQVNWFKWVLKEYIYSKEDKLRKSKKMMKIRYEGTLKELLETFNKEVKAFKNHLFNFYYQYKQYKLCAENLKECEALIHVDFSENYVCKFHQEVQAKHFVKDQITLHTGVLYLKDQRPISFCSISPNNQHCPESIWAHLDPVLNYIRTTHVNINIIHFFSDGPTTQYRQKKNFYLFSQNIYDYGFSHGTWSFFEAAHGKGAADGVGGAIKRTLDMKTAQGLDIPDAQTAYNALSSAETTVKIFYIPSESIQPLDPSIVKNLTPLPGTMKIHQLVTLGKYKLKYRDLSCFCENASGNCECHFPMYCDFAKSGSNKTLKRKNSSENSKQKQQKKKARRRENYSLSSESDSDTHIEYAESDASDVISDISRNIDLDFYSNENTHDKDLDENMGNFKKRIDPKKKINVLSTVIIQKPFKNSNNDLITGATIDITKDKDQKTRDLEDVQEESNTTEIVEIEKVTPLSEIRYSEENKAYYDLRMCKIFFDKGRKLGKENDANPTTSKTSIEVGTTEHTDHKFGIRYSINAEKLIQINHKQDDFNETETNENQKDETLDYCKIKQVEKISLKDKKNKSETQETMDLEVGASVIVRYYQRKQWKYYVGFITHILDKDNETVYKISFLKTVKSPNIYFLIMKKSEKDIVPINSIVKRVNLLLGESKEYFLKDDFDYVYFS